MRIKNGDFLRFGPRENRHFIVSVQSEPDPELDTEVQIQEDSKPNEERAALEAYLQKQKDKSHRELYEELLQKDQTPKQRKKEVQKPVYDRNEVTWGMVDAEIVYADRADEEIIRTDILRMLPNLTPRHLAKIEEFEKKQRKMKMLTVGLLYSERLQQDS